MELLKPKIHINTVFTLITNYATQTPSNTALPTQTCPHDNSGEFFHGLFVHMSYA